MNKVLVCSEIKGLKSALVKILPNLQFLQVSPEELAAAKTDETTLLVADTNNISPYLYNDPPAFGFVQGTWAGIDPLLPLIKSGQHPKMSLCRFTHDNLSYLIGEFAVGQVIAWERGFREMNANQDACLWNAGDKQKNGRCLSELTIGVLGTGQMGMAVAKLFKV